MSTKKLSELLVREQVIDLNQLENAKKTQKENGGRLSSALIKLGYVKDEDLADFLSKQYQVPAVDLTTFEVDLKAVQMLNKPFCDKHQVIPVSIANNVLVVAMADPSNLMTRDDVALLTRKRVEVVVATESAIQTAIEKYYASKVNYESIMTEIEKDTDYMTEKDMTSVEIIDVEKSGDDAPIIKFVNLMLSEAIKLRASDIHVEPYEKHYRVRFRIDGNLFEKIQPPPGISNAIASRIKIMSHMDIAERRRPQDGRLKINMKGGGAIDFRVSVIPTLFGEKVVMRLLDKAALQLDMTKLGFDKDQLDEFRKAIYQPFGMVLLTGPTGSGKTTTIYSALAELNKPDVNISTAEDPIEYNLEGINQVQMNPDVNLIFPTALRSFLRQDPDIIMVGEIRDVETAEIAFKAALTGHLVLSTLHTNDAPSSINRLLDMGVEPFLVTSAINMVVAQRLSPHGLNQY